LSTFQEKYLRMNVIPHLHKFVKYLDSNCQDSFLVENSARTKQFAFLRASPGWIPRRGTVGGTQGRIWGQVGRTAPEIHESCIGNVAARRKLY